MSAAAVPATRFDGCELREQLEPATPGELAEALRALAARSGAALVRGGGSRLACGNPLRGADALLSTRRLARIAVVDADEGVARAEAGVPLAALRDALRPTGWELPFDPPGDAATLGGTIAAAAAGPRYPQPRDAVLGLEVALAKGVLARSGGRVVKNVTGYDLPRLFTGSFGALGVIASAWIRLRPRPERCALLAASLAPAGAGRALLAARRPTARAAVSLDASLAAALGAGAVAGAARREPGLPADAPGAELAGEALLLVELAGDAPAVELDRLWLREQLGAAEVPEAALPRARELAGGAALPGAPPADLLVRVSVVATRVAAAAAALRAEGAATLSQPARGLVHARVALPGGDLAPAAPVLAAARAAATAGAGSVRIEAAPLALREQVDVFGEPGPRLALLRRLKAAFDPAGVLNPGRFAGRL